jgi:hypothetical protein
MMAFRFVHGDPITLIIMLIIEWLSQISNNAGPIAATFLKLVGVSIILPIIVFVVALLCGLIAAIFVRNRKLLFLAVSALALILYVVFCVPAAAMLLNDWLAFWRWLTIGIGGVVSLLAALVDSAIIVALVAMCSRIFARNASAP